MSKPNEGSDRIDYQETPDITEVHAAVEREKPEPSADVTPIPMWLTGLCAVATVWAGVYFGIFNGGLSGNVYNEYESSPAVLFPLPPKAGKAGAGEAQAQTLAQQGKAVYGQCVACHQPNGMGLPGQYPPLVKSEYVVGGEKRLVAILLKGVQGPITVEGKQYPGTIPMPPWEAALSPKKIAAVASFIRQEWGNSASEITEAQVIAAKKEFESQKAQWTEAQLLQIPADATLPGGGAAAPAGAPPAAAAPAPAAPGAAATTPAAAPAPGAPAPAPAAAGRKATEAELAEGQKQYMTVCFVCHQPTGLGLPSVFPPLTKSPYVNGSPERLAAIILKGNAGPFVVDGKPYNNIMIPQDVNPALDDAKIASIMTYVRASFGNTSGPVAPEVVAAARAKFKDRKTPWTQAELDAWKDDAAPAK